ncbi:hypothetical protein [Alkalitalea saponilacus]|nr:hypothetical protein [Alkalitalea saponilacus]
MTNIGDVSLENMINVANATPEIDGGLLDEFTVYGSSTYNGGSGSATILWLQVWMQDVYNPTQQEIDNMRRDLAKPRSEQDRTFTYYNASHAFSISIGAMYKGGTGQAGYTYGAPSGSNTVTRKCCGDDFWQRCTHLPPCEAYM